MVHLTIAIHVLRHGGSSRALRKEFSSACKLLLPVENYVFAMLHAPQSGPHITARPS
jgi:hypothetical protein